MAAAHPATECPQNGISLRRAIMVTTAPASIKPAATSIADDHPAHDRDTLAVELVEEPVLAATSDTVTEHMQVAQRTDTY
jgi:hypothetical protein